MESLWRNGAAAVAGSAFCRPSLRVGGLFSFSQALRAWLLSNCPSGTQTRVTTTPAVPARAAFDRPYGTGVFSHFPRHFVPGYYQAVPPGRRPAHNDPGGFCQGYCRSSLRDGDLFSFSQALRARLLSNCPSGTQTRAQRPRQIRPGLLSIVPQGRDLFSFFQALRARLLSSCPSGTCGLDPSNRLPLDELDTQSNDRRSRFFSSDFT
jgi:hypothetical protein